MFEKDSLHHAYFIEGEHTSVLSHIDLFIEKSFGYKRQGNPDVHYAYYESFGIDDGRALQEMQSLKPISGDKKFFIIALSSITSEAQNALLKVFEEPTPGSHFFVIARSGSILLPTLASRMMYVRHESADATSVNQDVIDFIESSYKDRLAFVVDLVEEKDKARIDQFVTGIIQTLSKRLLDTPLEKKQTAENIRLARELKEILTLSAYLKDRAPSLKLILERIALLYL